MIQELFRKDIKDFRPYDAKGEKYKIKLDANESFIGLSKEIKNKIIRSLIELEFNNYPDPDATKLKKAYGDYIGIDEKNIMVGNGSDELIQILTNAFLDKNEKIVTLNPDFSMYEVYTKVRGGKVSVFDLDEDFKLNVNKIIEYINEEKPKMFIFSNPNNPTGGVIPKYDIIKIIENVNCIVVVDEAYMEFYGDSILDYIKKYDNLIVLRTASKAIGSAALRLGFLITNDTLLREIKKVKPPFNVNSVSQVIGEIILKDKDFIRESIDKVLYERNYLLKELKKIDGLKVYETKSNFVLIYNENANEINESLIKIGIKVRSFTDENLKNFIRITVGSREQNIEVINCIKGDNYDYKEM
ncbi:MULTISPECIES: histidinol-phosphate transaminase [Clostridium]|uniref:Histidinol-phosphate aminotransferase n=1 Tax=Clostridium novyi (strain NT) TaxID=386415 RepID=HIS8_CLONN|nr:MULTISPECIES: histidinol-phosphate transaminase [Clostridium]A0PXP5.1 RecName: Full=Histidinol-phosphate aminotransferase; AltName: Full=Imidazole acetol-phosphate transaminase [Clostridium novyi NT]ABK61580.1 histidinol-phosphate aminotransferase [Clostridium novyi NT]KEH84913.1 histidinol-phosphate aminotransferase [Clostridium novyi A str. NCTC 538]KEH85121.1 histidinol-phosphate aminotransferase [Clostridium novyi A str. 4540]KEH91508.1 histidinol-phosphate aminotransferase [Clostridium